MVEIIRIIAVLVAAIMLGNWFLAELRRTRAQGKAWYWAYFSLPGVLILLALLLPLILWVIRRSSTHG